MKKIIGYILISPILIPLFIIGQIIFTIVSILGLLFWIGIDLANDENNAIDVFIYTNKMPYLFISNLFD